MVARAVRQGSAARAVGRSWWIETRIFTVMGETET